MHSTYHATRLQTIFDELEYALLAFAGQVTHRPAGSPERDAVLAEFEVAWQRFLSEWSAVLNMPSRTPAAVPMPRLRLVASQP